jgi:hypothetical protein
VRVGVSDVPVEIPATPSCKRIGRRHPTRNLHRFISGIPKRIRRRGNTLFCVDPSSTQRTHPALKFSPLCPRNSSKTLAYRCSRAGRAVDTKRRVASLEMRRNVLNFERFDESPPVVRHRLPDLGYTEQAHYSANSTHGNRRKLAKMFRVRGGSVGSWNFRRVGISIEQHCGDDSPQLTTNNRCGGWQGTVPATRGTRLAVLLR